MQKVDKILVGTIVPIIAAIVVAAVVLGVYGCASGYTYDKEAKKCRQKCANEGKPGGQRYDGKSKMCVCADKTPVWTGKECIGECSVGETWNSRTQQCEPGSVTKCSPLRSVNAATGVVENPTHFPRDGNTCSAGTSEELSQLCQASPCDSPACGPGDRWDGYSKEGRCFKKTDCSRVPCDASYCTAPTVVNALGNLVKQQDGTQCGNPSEAQVAGMCNALPSYTYKSSNCLITKPYTDIAVNILSHTLDDISGTVEHPLVNGVLDLDATGALQYTYTISPPSSVRLNKRQVYQLRTGDAPNVAEGLLTITGLCSTNSDAHVCFNFAIPPLPQTVQPGTYLLNIAGYPAWDNTLALYTLEKPILLSLPRTNVDPSIIPNLNVKFNTALALQAASQLNLINKNLKALHERCAQEKCSTQVLTELAAGGKLGIENQPDRDAPLLVVCADTYCMSSERVNAKLVVLAWAPVKVDESTVCASGDKYVKYVLMRQLPSSGGQIDEDVLIGPDNQPSAEEVASGTISFYDLVPLNTSVVYKLASYLVNTPNATTDYNTASCKSDVFTKSLSSGLYTAALCHSIPTPDASSVPPYMVMTPEGMCSSNATQSARDFYCTYVWPGTSDTPKSPGFQNYRVALYSPAQKACAYVVPSTPQLGTNEWTSPFCGDPTSSTDRDKACFTGLDQTVNVTCAKSVVLQDADNTVESLEGLADRLNNVYKDFNVYNFGSFSRDPLKSDNVKTMLSTFYFQCPPSSVSNWATDPAACSCGSITLTRQPDESAETFAQRMWSTISGETALNSGGYTQALTIVNERDAQMGQDALQRLTYDCRTYKPLCDLALSLDYLKDNAKAFGCGNVDAVCSTIASQANCGHNECGRWESTSVNDKTEGSVDSDQVWSLSRKCFGSPDVTNQNPSPCCSGFGTYNFKGIHSSCSCDERHLGKTCSEDPCRDAFPGGRECMEPNSEAVNGKCIANKNAAMTGLKFQCVCNPGFFNVAPNTAMDKYRDCKFYTDIRHPYSVDVPTPYDPTKTSMQPCTARDDKGNRLTNCIIDPYSCTCPGLCTSTSTKQERASGKCIEVDPKVCRQNAPKLDPNLNTDYWKPRYGLQPTNYNPQTGCYNDCSSHVPQPDAQYKYYQPELNDFRCAQCRVGDDCQQTNAVLDDLNCNNSKGQNNPRCKDLKYLKELYPTAYCPDCCFYYCKKDSHDHHKCDLKHWPPYS